MPNHPQVTLRVRKPQQRLPDELPLDEAYTLEDVQAVINEALDQGNSAILLLQSGAVFEFIPGDYEVMSAAYPVGE